MTKEITPAGVVLDRIIELYAAARDEFGPEIAARHIRSALPRAIDGEGALTVLTCAVARLAGSEVTP